MLGHLCACCCFQSLSYLFRILFSMLVHFKGYLLYIFMITTELVTDLSSLWSKYFSPFHIPLKSEDLERPTLALQCIVLLTLR